MNRNFHTIALIFLLVSIIPIPESFARKLEPAKQEKCVSCTGEVDVKISNMDRQESLAKMEAIDSFNKLMGLEESNSCKGGLDEEDCLRRRDMLEAHLDYIYTQQHKP